MSRARIVVSASLLAALLGGATACEASRYDHVDLYRVGGHSAAELDDGGIRVPEGGVIVFEAQPRAESSSPEYVGFERFKLRPTDPDVATAYRSILRDTWVVSGMGIGSTRLQVLVDDEVVDDMPIEVVAAEEVAP